MRAKILRAAELTVIAERARVIALANGDADAMRDLVRAERLASSAVEALGSLHLDPSAVVALGALPNF
jgi:hypothetical protein